MECVLPAIDPTLARGSAGWLGLHWRGRARSRGGPSLLELLTVPVNHVRKAFRNEYRDLT